MLLRSPGLGRDTFLALDLSANREEGPASESDEGAWMRLVLETERVGVVVSLNPLSFLGDIQGPAFDGDFDTD